MTRWMILFVLFATLYSAPSRAADTNAPAVNQPRIFQVAGVVKELPTDGKTVVIQHEAITNYMPAMTMPFSVKNTNELRGLQTGDAIHFQMVVTDSDGWIEHVTKASSPAQPSQPSRFSFRQVRDVEALNIGAALPEYHFTNELGRAISTKQFQGQAFAFTFFFTLCPFPTFCPLMSKNFEATQKILLAQPGAPTNWHLFSISFDTETDSPATLKEYAGRYHYQPAHWSFLTGDLVEITAIADQVGEYFGHDQGGGVTHNLRTVVIDARGRVQKIFTGNAWTSEELAAEIVKAAKL